MIKNRLSIDLSSLNDLDVAGMSTLWRRNFGGKAPEHLPRPILARLIAFRLQIQPHGNISKSAASYLHKVEVDLKAGRNAETPYVERRQLKPGVQLVREHEGVMHRVTVLEDAYTWNDNRYPSLSAVAKAITGTQWNGNRFFGLTEKLRSKVGAAP